ncbi:MAG TPA: hypothetical protein VEW08_01310 [Steroidobacteraceae bacterium]|nr:hypothetical protein [Steroidobacteraceae bacterium]
MNRATCLIAALVAASALAAPSSMAQGPPLASAWNIAASGSATSSGDLDFRITPNDGSNPVDITVPVISGAGQDSVARSIGRALSSQLRSDRYNVQLGENGNVLVTDPRGQPNFSLELVDSNIESVRVAVQIVTPAAPPTAPMQAAPAEAPPAIRPDNTVPGNAAPPPANAPPSPNPAPDANEAAGAPSSPPPPR